MDEGRTKTCFGFNIITFDKDNMNKQDTIEDLRSLNQTYGERANEAFNEGNYQKGVTFGQKAEAFGAAAKELENGVPLDEINERWDGILDF